MSTPDEPVAAPGPGVSPPDRAIQAAPPAAKAPDPGPADRPLDRPITAAELTRATGQLDRILAALLFVLAFALASFAIHNSDFWMHLATGRALANGTYDVFAGNDPFSYTTEGVRWINHAWLYDWAVYALFGLLGAAGLIVLKALVVLVLGIVLFQIRRPGQSPWAPVVCVDLALLALSPKLLFQPALISFLFLGLTLFVLLQAVSNREADADHRSSSRLLWVLPPLFALWANLDDWFVLGPLTVVLFLLGDCLQQFLAGSGKSELKSRKELALVLGVGLAACLLNPNGVYVFALPPELAYLVVQVTGPVPSAYLAGGNALSEITRVEPLAVASPLQREFWGQAASGLNVAGMSYFVLLGLGLLSFVVAAPAGIRSRAAGLPAGFGPRLVIWLVYAGMSLFMIRLIPFFAVVAGPIAALNFQDFAQACFGAQVRLEGKWRLWSLGGRLASAAGFLALLFLAWPGWLHASPDNPRLTHRIAWRLDQDPSLRRAALRIGELQQAGRLRHGFNYSPEVADYLSWFSPGAKGFIDTRLALFAGCADQYVRARLALRQEGEFFLRLRLDPRNAPRAPPHDWDKVFRERKINYVILSRLHQDTLLSELALNFWINQASWVPLYADGRTVIFGWKDDGPPDQFAGLEWDLNRLAFGPVPPELRAPEQAPEPPDEPRGFWQHYWLGPPQTPLTEATSRQCIELFETVAARWPLPYFVAWQIACWPGPVGTGAVVPGSVSGPAAAVAFARFPHNVLMLNSPRFLGQVFLRSVDAGPPGAVLMAVRSARRAVAASPADPASQLDLANAYQDLWMRQEQNWVSRQRPGGPADFKSIDLLGRQTLRMIQVLAARNHFVNLEGDRSNLQIVQVHWELARLYESMHYLDLGLEHLGRARDLLADIEPQPGQKDDITRKREVVDRFYKVMSAEVKKRRDYYDLKVAEGKQTVLGRFEIALLAPYRTTDENNRPTVDGRGLGLARLALDVLRQANLSSLPDEEKRIYAKFELVLLLTMGRAREAREGLVVGFRPLLGPEYDVIDLAISAATGDYARADEAQAALEKRTAALELRDQAQRQKVLQQTRSFLLMTLAFDPPLHQVPVARAAQYMLQQIFIRIPPVPPLPDRKAPLQALRGLLALEQGATSAAEMHFRMALRRPGSFPDRPIAERYLKLLSQP